VHDVLPSDPLTAMPMLFTPGCKLKFMELVGVNLLTAVPLDDTPQVPGQPANPDAA
jgi:hypothetical protein